MTVSFRQRVARYLALAAVALASLAGVAHADDLLASRLGALLGEERQALAVVPTARLVALTAPPPSAARSAPDQVHYDTAWLDSLPKATGDAQWQCLSQALYFEARGESVRGMFAVGEVILNRVDSGLFPSSVCGVVHQGCQFSYLCDGRSDAIHEQAAWDEVGKVARVLLDGAQRNLTHGATYYHTVSVTPSWARHFDQTAAIGAHLFYRNDADIVTAAN
ncbi:MAG: cell wall hydrolase [Limimaricola sp.]|uniref:cell wall hydrolase n=1 Tax=Limimaricola sp. TaxID=2211665 RepID=UPI001DD13B32|nr:cell wall hydrolase [Limimaricola sp.]MBI1416173.1 cell wall hydrolase [Limimaricola sp.]